MAKLGPKVQHLTVYLLDRSVKRFEDAISDKTARRYRVDQRSGVDGVLYVRPSQPDAPDWLDFVGPGLARVPKAGVLVSSGASAVLLVRDKRHKRIFAFTFGFGRVLLALDKVDDNFGLRATINSVDPARLRSVDLHTLEELPVHTRRQMSRSSPLETFGIDPAHDMLRAVTGEPTDKALGTRLTGATSLSLNVGVGFRGLPGLCSRLLEAAEKKTYRDRFSWIDQLGRVQEARTIALLDDELTTAINDPARSASVHLAVPEPLEFRNVRGYSYLAPDPDKKVQDLDIKGYLQARNNKRPVTADDLRRSAVYALFDDGQEGWSVRRCALYEVKRGDRLYVLTNGQWFEVAESFVDSVHSYIRQVKVSDLPFPEAGRDEVEGDYNIRLAEEFKNRGMPTSLLDKKTIKWIVNQSGIEVCDVLTRHRGRTAFVHVKRHSRSGTLSHLFSQGLVSGEAFVQDPSFREKVGPEVGVALRGHFGTDRPEPKDYDIVYAIVAAGTEKLPLALPFFSKVALMSATRRLVGLGYHVRIARVPVG